LSKAPSTRHIANSSALSADKFPLPDDDEFDFYEGKEKEMTDTSKMFFKENSVEFNKVD
jgi:hypothetical protein